MTEKTRQKLVRQLFSARRKCVNVCGIDSEYADKVRDDYRLIRKLSEQFLASSLVSRTIERASNV